MKIYSNVTLLNDASLTASALGRPADLFKIADGLESKWIKRGYEKVCDDSQCDCHTKRHNGKPLKRR